MANGQLPCFQAGTIINKLNLISLLFLFGIVCGCSSTPTKVVFESPEQIRNVKKVAVFPFACNRSETGKIIADALAANLNDSRFSVIEKGRLQTLLEDQSLTPNSVSEDHRPALGKLKGVDAIITGSASVRAFRGYIDYVAETTARMIDMTTGDVLLEVHFTSEDISRFSMKGTIPAEQIGKELAKKFSSY